MLTRHAVRRRAQRAVPVIGEKCSKCGSQDSLTRHHEDYAKPLEVVILCRSCHGKLHAEQRWASRQKFKNCIQCGNPFRPKRAREKTCSRSCGNKNAWSKR